MPKPLPKRKQKAEREKEVPSKSGIDFIDNLKSQLDKLPRPKMSEVGALFVRKIGGTQRFAEILVNAFTEAPEGSVSQHRILAMVMRLLEEDKDQFDPTAFDDMDRNDLMKVTAQLMIEVEKIRERQRTAEGSAETGTGAPAEGSESAATDPSDRKEEQEAGSGPEEEDEGDGEGTPGEVEGDASDPDTGFEDGPASGEDDCPV